MSGVATYRRDDMRAGQPCAFLDRDGTIIAERHYLGDQEGVAFESGAVAGLRQLEALGYLLVVITNQSGIGRGLLTREQVDGVNRRADELLQAHGVRIAAWYICPHTPDEACDCRKPSPGMVDRAARELNIDLSRSLVVGDKDADLGLAKARNMAGYLVLTGHGVDHVGWARRNSFSVHTNLENVAATIAVNQPIPIGAVNFD